MPESLVFSHAKILFLVSLLFGALRSIPTHYLIFLIFNYSSLFAFIFHSMLAYKHNSPYSRHLLNNYRRLLQSAYMAKRLYLEVHVMMKKRHAGTIISHEQARVLCDVINRSRNSLSTPFVSFSPFLSNIEQGRIMKDKRNHHGAVDKP